MLLRTSPLSSTVSVKSNLPSLSYFSQHECPALSVPYQISLIYDTSQSTTVQHCQCHIKSPQFILFRKAPLSSTVSVISILPNFCHSAEYHCTPPSVSYQISPIYVTPQFTTFQHCHCHIRAHQLMLLRT
jgi:hypothetical protein